MFKEEIVKVIIDVIVSTSWKQRNNDTRRGNVSLEVTKRSTLN